MPHHDIPRPQQGRPNRRSPIERVARQAFTAAMNRDINKRRRRKDPDVGGVPVEPNRPNTLIGGAEAELDFED